MKPIVVRNESLSRRPKDTGSASAFSFKSSDFKGFCIQFFSVQPLKLNCLPLDRKEVGSVLWAVFEPWGRVEDSFIGFSSKPSAPPTKGTVGDNVMLALTHEVEVSIVFFWAVVVNCT